MKTNLFISHANKTTDNELSLWLGLQLTKLGYDVWLDLMRLRGGESHWADIERAIRNDSAKFLYVLSDASNTTDPRISGPSKELSVALGIREKDVDFVIPLRSEPLSESTTIHLQGINAVDFHRRGWARGLSDLLDKLEMDGVTRSEGIGPSAVASWWRERCAMTEGVEDRDEVYWSNWFAVDNLPENIHYYSLGRAQADQLDMSSLGFPAFVEEKSKRLVTFASSDEVTRSVKAQNVNAQLAFGGKIYVESTKVKGFVQYGSNKPRISKRDARAAVVRLMGRAWEDALTNAKVRRHDMSGLHAFWFPANFAKSNKAYYGAVQKKRSYRQLVGVYKGRTWHFALSGHFLLDPKPMFVVRTHVLFSDDGKTIWESDRKLHRARRAACSQWWNDDWRDRLLAAMRWIAGDQEHLGICVSNGETVQVRTVPYQFLSPVGYKDPVRRSSLTYYEADDFDPDEADG